MDVSGSQLGRTLALLEIHDGNVEKIKHQYNLSEFDKNVVERLYHRLNNLNSSSQEAAIFEKLPAHSCPYGQPIFATKNDIFLVLIFNSSQNHTERTNFSLNLDNKHCEKMHRHLNSCYRCFTYYVEVMRSYYHALQDYSGNSGETS